MLSFRNCTFENHFVLWQEEADQSMSKVVHNVHFPDVAIIKASSKRGGLSLHPALTGAISALILV